MTFCIRDISQIQTTTPVELNKPNRFFKDTRATFIRGGVVNSYRNGKTPKYYYYGDRISQILHTRLRTGCSALRYYLYNRNLVPDALCFCGTVENNFHFL